MAYSEKEKKSLVNKICHRIEQGKSVVDAINEVGSPTRTLFYEWLRASEEFQDKYARACLERAEKIFEECLTIADSQEGDLIMVDGKECANHDFIQRAKLRVDTRKWMLGKMNPKKYGDRQIQQHEGEIVQKRVDLTPQEIRDINKELESEC
jgi:hypothetical protein